MIIQRLMIPELTPHHVRIEVQSGCDIAPRRTRMNQLHAIAILLISSIAGEGAFQDSESAARLTCADTSRRWSSGHSKRVCEIRTSIVAAAPGLRVQTANGGISVRGWARNSTLVHAKVDAWARSEQQARALANRIEIVNDDGSVTARAPRMRRGEGYAVTYEVFVPSTSNLSARSENGGISISNVRGDIDFDARNGSVLLDRVGGRVRGSAGKGGLTIQLAGSGWEGAGANVIVSEGVLLELPAGYSARLELESGAGRIVSDFPDTGQTKQNRAVALDLGAGGAVIRAVSEKGPVVVRQTSR
jgi:hypothetical protein